MTTAKYIAVDDFCNSSQIEISFVQSLSEKGLIEVLVIQEQSYIEADQLQQLEKLVRFHYEMDINLEGIETIVHLLQRINHMHDEITNLGNKLRLYQKTGR